MPPPEADNHIPKGTTSRRWLARVSPPFFVSVRTMARGFEVKASKVPEVTLGFWIIKILATTLGETGGDSVTMTWLKADVMANSGYLVGSAIFLSALIVLVVIQIAAKKF